MTQFTEISQVKSHLEQLISEAQIRLNDLIRGLKKQEIDFIVQDFKKARQDFLDGKSERFLSDEFDLASGIIAERNWIKSLKESKKMDLMITNCPLNRFQVPEGLSLISPAGFHHSVDNVFCLVAK